MNTILSAASLLALVANGGPLTSESTTPPTPPTKADEGDNVITWMWKDGLRAQTADGSFKFKLGGRILWDNTFIARDSDISAAGISTEDGSEFRTSRLFISGDIYDEYFFKAQYDFAGTASGTTDSRPGFKDVFLGKKDVIGSADVKAGHFKEPFSLEEQTSSRFLTFLERGLPNVFSPGRNNGVMVYDTAADGVIAWALGFFKQGTDNAGFEMNDDGWAVTARVAASPVYEDDGETVVHVGLAYSMRDADGARFRQRPEIHNSPRWVDTGATASEDVDLLGIELGGVLGPVHGSIEYMTADVDGGSDPTFSGYYGTVGFFLTGESRPYSRSKGSWGRVKPASNYTKDGGKGAVEVAARVSSVDLQDGGVTGGELDNFGLALNWYLTPNTRVGVNWIHADLDTVGETDLFGVRLQVDW